MLFRSSLLLLVLTLLTRSLSAADLGERSALVRDSAATSAVIEFHNPAQDHYFITADAREISDLDAGIHPGWQRTGFSFDAYASAQDGASPVCRFYIPPLFGDSHF